MIFKFVCCLKHSRPSQTFFFPEEEEVDEEELEGFEKYRLMTPTKENLSVDGNIEIH